MKKFLAVAALVTLAACTGEKPAPATPAADSVTVAPAADTTAKTDSTAPSRGFHDGPGHRQGDVTQVGFPTASRPHGMPWGLVRCPTCGHPLRGLGQSPHQ